LTFLLFAMVITVSSCGGGGGGATGPTSPNTDSSSNLVITVTPVVSTLPANTLDYPAFNGSPFQTQVDVRVAFGNGQGVATGTIVHLQTNNGSIAFVGIPDDPSTDDIDEFAEGFVGVNQETIGSNATFYIRSFTSPGTATFTANATHPTNGRNFETTFNFTVTPGPDPTVVLLDAILPRTTLPINALDTPFYSGTPFQMEADVQVKDVFGNFTNPAAGSTGDSLVNVSITPANVLYFTTLDDVTTIDVDEFIAPRLIQGSIEMNSGHGSLFLWSRGIPGIATVTLSAIEAGTGRQLSNTFNITVVDDGSDPGTPTSVVLNNDGGALYTNGSGGASSNGLNVNVTSGAVPVLDPQVNNVNLTLITDAGNSGERLSGTNVSGSSVQGTSINVATVNGIVNALVSSGSNSNTITVVATADRADNNVDNGVQDAITSRVNYIISDGVLWALDLTTSRLDVLTVNGEITSDPGATELIYDFQDGTYSLLISAIATDKSGNPALPQTLQFGMINSPISGYPDNGSGSFVISGFDGNPQEGGSSFSAVGGAFITAAQGVQASDTLIVFGEESLGNEDLESAVSVASVNSETNLTIVERFNRNDETGSINNDGGVLPYAIGRAVDGNISATAVINNIGVASTRLNYPVSQLGKLAAIYVKGQGPINNNTVKSITDVSLITFPGVEGFNGQSSRLIASPASIPGNRSVNIVVCLEDSAQNRLPGRFVSFSYVGEGSGSIDGFSGSGTMLNPTGASGCTVGLATTTGVIPGSTETGFDFVAGLITCDLTDSSNTNCIDVTSSASGVLNANPSAIFGSGEDTITLTLYDGSGNPIEGAAISGSCDQVPGGFLSIESGPSLTDAFGQSIVVVSSALDAPDAGLNGSCTFATASGSPTVTVNFTGGDSCALGNPSPVPPTNACEVTAQFRVGGTVTGMTSTGPLVLQNNNGSDVTITGNSSFLFAPQNDGTVYLITVLTQPPGQTCSVSGGVGTLTSNVTNVAVTCM
jgi:hypothetical protein